MLAGLEGRAGSLQKHCGLVVESVHLRSGGDLQGSAASGKCWVLGHTLCTV